MGVSLRCWLNRGGVGGGVQAASFWLLDVEASAALAAAATTTTISAVAVMAPALTEAGPQKPDNLLPPAGALPSGGFLSADQAKQVCLSASTVHPKKNSTSNAKDTTTICHNHEVLAQFVVSANVQPSEIDEQCLQGIPKDLINDVINLKFGNGLDGLSDLIGAVLPRKEVAAASASAAVARTTTTNTGAGIMSDPSMGDDPADSMCIFKSIMGPGETEEACEIADIVGEVAGVQGVTDVNDALISSEKQTEEDRALEEQIMGIAADLNAQSVDATVPNVDELLQVIKSLDTVESAENRLNDGCAGMVEASSQGSASEGVSEIFSDGDINILNDVIGMCNNIADSGIGIGIGIGQQPQPQEQFSQLSLQTQVAQLQAECESRQREIDRRTDFLLRRLRKAQMKILGEHVAGEIGNVLEEAQKSAKKAFQQDLASLGPKAGNARNFPELAGNMNSFLQKVSKTCNALGNSIAVRQRNSCRYFGAGSKDNYISTANRGPVFGVPQIKLNGEQVEKVMGSLATKLKIVQDAFDSDCTASSSGGESCDEMQTFNNPHQQQLTIAKRAAWQWAKDRANVAARWTWLQAQISDLEFKIRQYNDLQQKIRATKGYVILESTLESNSTSDSAPSIDSTVNGYSGVLPGSSHHNDVCSFGETTATLTSAATTSSACGASRTRPFVRPLFRKRKLLQLGRLHEVSKKAARPTNLKCTCDGVRAPCGLCTGRKEPMIDQETMDLLSVPERVAAVDPGFHSVLSFPDEITHTVHINAIMRSTEWQQKMLRGGLRMTKIKDPSNERRRGKVTEHRTKYPGRLKKTQNNLMSAKIKRKVLKDKRSRSSSERSNHGITRKRVSSKYPSHSAVDEEDDDDDDEEEEASAFSSSSKYSSPVPSPMQNSNTVAGILPEKNTLKEKSSTYTNSRARTNSYDIDNIVIPQSMAASARPEKLPYKEIEIPKWRVVDLFRSDINNGAIQRSLSENDFEDISEETILRRHDRSEKEEAKRFREKAKKSFGIRRRRTESKMDSGTNTPDPMSPHTSEFGGDTMSPITSPPATPLNVYDEQSQSEITLNRSGPQQNAARRRPSTRSLKEESPTITSIIEKEPKDEDKENEKEKTVAPYEPRTFPLSDVDYQKMLGIMPKLDAQPLTSGSFIEVNKVEEMDDQESDSTESAVNDMETEDPNDPEWTVAESRDTEKERIRPTAKR